MAAEEIKPLPAFTEVNQSRLLRMQLQSQPGQHFAGKLLGVPGLVLAAAGHDEVSRREEFHLPALAEPDVNLAAHPAPIVQPSGRSPQRQCANRPG